MPDEPGPQGRGRHTLRPARTARSKVWGFLREIIIVGGSALLISLVLKTFFILPFFIPSESMEPVLIEDDRVVVNKLAPGPFDLQRGDIVVFEDPGGWLSGATIPEMTALQRVFSWVGLYPENAGEHLIKRVIGLPGDQVLCCDDAGLITVNGVAITEPYIVDGAVASQLPFDIVVPDDHLWVMGDNRPRSADSRYNSDSAGGPFVPVENVVGRAFVVMLPLDRFTLLERPDDTFADVPDP